MAFGVDIKTRIGVNATYWKIAKVEKSKISKCAYISLYGFLSKETTGFDKIESRFVNTYPEDYEEIFGLDKLNQEGMNEDKSLYEFMKIHIKEFEDAVFI